MLVLRDVGAHFLYVYSKTQVNARFERCVKMSYSVFSKTPANASLGDVK
jgi:hypothetical protein